MKVEEFFAKYANTPLKDRFVAVNYQEFGLMTLHDIYKKLTKIEDKIRPYVIEEDQILRQLEWLKIFEPKKPKT